MTQQVRGPAIGTFDEETYNRYLLDDSGPKKRIDYSQMVDPDDMSSFDADIGTSMAAEPKAVEGQYRMKHTNEKFSLGGARPQGSDNQAQ